MDESNGEAYGSPPWKFTGRCAIRAKEDEGTKRFRASAFRSFLFSFLLLSLHECFRCHEFVPDEGGPFVSERALYQLNLVRVEDAHHFVPKDLPMVKLFGYTIGGFYLARYDDSPAGKMNEMVALAGLVWDPPVSCAWASHVYVDKASARDHGLSCCGLPSKLATFRERHEVGRRVKKKEVPWWIHGNGLDSNSRSLDVGVDVHTMDGERGHVCSITLPSVPVMKTPAVPLQMALPSFSGRTLHMPQLLKYALELKAKVRFVKPARIVPGAMQETEPSQRALALHGILSGRPLLAMSFEGMEMEVGEPKPAQVRSNLFPKGTTHARPGSNEEMVLA